MERIVTMLKETWLNIPTEIEACDNHIHLEVLGKFIDNDKNELIKPINAIVRLNGEILNTKDLLIPYNDSEENKEYTFALSTTFNGKLYKNTIVVVQKPRQLKPFEYEKSIPLDITLESSKINILNDGGVIPLKVILHYEKQYVQKDYCGNVVSYSSTTDNYQNVATLCTYTLSDTINFKRNGVNIKVSPQPFNNDSRSCQIIATYQGLTSSIVLNQEEGKKKEIHFHTTFKDDKKEGTFAFNSSLKDENGEVIIYPMRDIIINGECTKSFIEDSIILEYDCSWLNMETQVNDDSVSLLLKSLYNNTHIDRDLTCDVKIYANNINSPYALLHVTLPRKTVSKVQYNVGPQYESYYNSKTIKGAKMLFETSKTLIYNDGSKELVKLDSDESFGVKWKSTNPSLLQCGEAQEWDMNGTYVIKLKSFGKHIDEDVMLKVFPVFYDNEGNMIQTNIQPYIIRLEHDKRIKNIHILSFDEDALVTQRAVILNSTNKKEEVNIHSIMETFVDDVLQSSITCEYDYAEVNNDYSHFKMKKSKNGYVIQPTKENITEDVGCTYRIYQKDNKNAFINLIVRQEATPIKVVKSYDVKVILKKHESHIGYNKWYNESILSIKLHDEILIDVPKIWIPSKENSDVIFHGELKLYSNEVYNLTIQPKEGREDHNLYHQCIFETNSNEIEIIVYI